MQTLKHIINVLVALLIVLSTTGVTLHKHYCMGHVRNVALMHEAESCPGEGTMDMPGDCCKDTVEEFKIEELNKAAFNFDGTPELYVVTVLSDFIVEIILDSRVTGQTAFLNYKPPLIERDIPITVQSFLL